MDESRQNHQIEADTARAELKRLIEMLPDLEKSLRALDDSLSAMANFHCPDPALERDGAAKIRNLKADIKGLPQALLKFTATR